MFESVLREQSGAKYVPQFDCFGELEGIKALTLEGQPFEGQKTKIFAYYGLPKNVTGKVPAVVLVHGGGGHAYACWVKFWNERGYAAVAIDTTGYLPKVRNAGEHEDHDEAEKWSRELGDVFAEEGYVPAPDNDKMMITGKALGDHWMFHAVAGCIKANTFLREQPEIDSEKIGVVGISWGGVITSILLGHDNRFAFGVPIYGSGYLAEGLSEIDTHFVPADVRKHWLAETRFHQVTMPVLWLAWNNDSAFSIQSNTLSYLATVKHNEKTRLSFVNEMYHSHWRAWVREEAYLFADSVVKGKKFPQLCDLSSGDAISLNVIHSEDDTIQSASLYYITEPMTYGKQKPEEGAQMEQTWQILPLNVNGDTIAGELPQDAVGFYVGAEFVCGEREVVVTTAYKERSV